jgi:hypothetical protein
MQYPWLRWVGSGYVQFPLLHGMATPFTVSCRPPAKLEQVPERISDVVSWQVAAVPSAPDWNDCPSGTLNATGFEQRPEQGEAL